MKQSNFILSMILLSVNISSCKKEDKPEPIEPKTYKNFSQLKVGNYWIYQRFDIDTNGVAVAKNEIDSSYVEKDTIINNTKYYKLVENNQFNMINKDISYRRDSLHYVVNHKGEILFSSEDFTTIFQTSYQFAGTVDTLCKVENQMVDKDLEVITPAGTFVTSSLRLRYFMYPRFSLGGSIRNRYTRYSENIGVVTETLLFFNVVPDYTERRLVRYKVN